MRLLLFQITFYLCLTSLVTLVKAKSVTFFEHEGGIGDFHCIDFEGLQCYNIPSHFNNKTSSVNTHDNCIFAYDDIDCQGRKEVIAPGTPSHNNLGKLGFNDKISSFRQCDPYENVCSGVKVEMDYSEALDLRDLAFKMKKTIEEWYPRICRFLWSPAFREVGSIKLRIDGKNVGVAAAGRNRITVHAKYYRRRPDDLGSIIHELAHIIQHHEMCAGWLTEAIADYPRRWFYERRKPEKPNGEFVGSSHTYFLRWIDERWPNTIYRLNHACRKGTYDDGLLQRLTGKNEMQLWQEMKQKKIKSL